MINWDDSSRALRILLSCLFLAITSVSVARADGVTYTYTGSPFANFSGTFSCSGGVGECELSGSITFASALPDNLTFVPPPVGLPVLSPTPIAFSFTDGVNTLTNLNSTFYGFLGTSPDGGITSWVFDISGVLPEGTLTFASVNNVPPSGLPNFGYSLSELQFGAAPLAGQAGTLGFEEMSPDLDAIGQAGTWSGPTVNAPEPPMLMLLIIGLLAIVVHSYWLRKASAI